jgi:PAS domain S-box-containing protein
MQYPEITTACIRYGDEAYYAGAHGETPWRFEAPFHTADGVNGVIEVAYREPRPEQATGPFLAEETTLLSSLAEMIRAAIDRQNAERSLREAHERMNLAFRAARMGLWEWDVVRNTVHWSEQLSDMLGLSGVGAGKFAENSHIIHPEDRDRVLERLARAADGADDLREIDLRMQGVDGGWLHLTGRGMVVREPPARATRIVVALVDVTERRLLQETLRQRVSEGE